MIEEPYILKYNQKALAEMSRKKRDIFQEPLRKYVINTIRYTSEVMIGFAFSRENLLLAVEKWPWLLTIDLRVYNEKESDDIGSDKWVTVK